MTIKFEAVKAGDVLYSCYVSGRGAQRHHMVRSVEVLSIDASARTAKVRTASVGVRTVSARDIERYRRSPPKEKA